jgi:hypothetical protein
MTISKIGDRVRGAVTTVSAAVARDEKRKCDRPDRREDRTVIEYGHVAESVPEHSGDKARNELQQANRGIVPADATGAQLPRHEIRCHRFPDRTKDPLGLGHGPLLQPMRQ